MGRLIYGYVKGAAFFMSFYDSEAIERARHGSAARVENPEVHLCECAIDVMPYATLCKVDGIDWRWHNLLSLAGVYQPKKKSEESKLPVAGWRPRQSWLSCRVVPGGEQTAAPRKGCERFSVPPAGDSHSGRCWFPAGAGSSASAGWICRSGGYR